MALSPEMKNMVLGAISDARGKPNQEEIEKALEQLAEWAAAICKVMPGGTSDKFLMQFAMAMERRSGPQPEEE